MMMLLMFLHLDNYCRSSETFPSLFSFNLLNLVTHQGQRRISMNDSVCRPLFFFNLFGLHPFDHLIYWRPLEHISIIVMQ